MSFFPQDNEENFFPRSGAHYAAGGRKRFLRIMPLSRRIFPGRSCCRPTGRHWDRRCIPRQGVRLLWRQTAVAADDPYLSGPASGRPLFYERFDLMGYFRGGRPPFLSFFFPYITSLRNSVSTDGREILLPGGRAVFNIIYYILQLLYRVKNPRQSCCGLRMRHYRSSTDQSLKFFLTDNNKPERTGLSQFRSRFPARQQVRGP